MKFTLHNHVIGKTYDLTQENLNAAIETAVSWHEEAHLVLKDKKELAERVSALEKMVEQEDANSWRLDFLEKENVRLRSVIDTIRTKAQFPDRNQPEADRWLEIVELTGESRQVAPAPEVPHVTYAVAGCPCLPCASIHGEVSRKMSAQTQQENSQSLTGGVDGHAKGLIPSPKARKGTPPSGWVGAPALVGNEPVSSPAPSKVSASAESAGSRARPVTEPSTVGPSGEDGGPAEQSEHAYLDIFQKATHDAVRGHWLAGRAVPTMLDGKTIVYIGPVPAPTKQAEPVHSGGGKRT